MTMTDNTAVTHPNPPPVIYVKGSHTEIGHQIGEACRPLIQHSIANAKELVGTTYENLQLTWEGAKIQARKYMPFAQERYPQYVDELVGMAEGADVNYTELAVVNALEAVTTDSLHLTKCTSLAVNELNTADGHVLVAHNEDWLPDDEPDVYIIHARPDDEPSFLAMSYGGLLANIGFNEEGIAQCCDSVYPSDSRIGIPRVIVSRAVLGARSIGTAIRHMLVPLRAAGYNHMLVHESGEMYNVEVSARSFDIIYGTQGILAHTNNYVSPKMEAIEASSDELIHTRVRYFRALHLLSETKKHNTKTLESILKDHVNYPDSICNHSVFDIDPLDREKTIISLIMDLTARKMIVAWGNPCKNSYHTYNIEI
jgi:isopenicillin-N N-acyltransferase like protein